MEVKSEQSSDEEDRFISADAIKVEIKEDLDQKLDVSHVTDIDSNLEDDGSSVNPTKYCPICNKTFDKLKMHYNAVHLGLKPHKCDECEKSFSQKVHFNVHKQTVHEGRKDHQCGQCGTMLTTKSGLVR